MGNKYPMEISVFDDVKIKLTEEETLMEKDLCKLFVRLLKDTGLCEKLSDDEIQSIHAEAAVAAHALVAGLLERGIEVQWSKSTIDNRIKTDEDAFDPKQVEFYRHYHVLEDLLHFLQQGKAYACA